MHKNILLENNLPLYCDGLKLYGDFRNMIRFESALYDEALSNSQKIFIGLSQLFSRLPQTEEEILQHTDVLNWFYTIGGDGDIFEKTAPETYERAHLKNSRENSCNVCENSRGGAAANFGEITIKNSQNERTGNGAYAGPCKTKINCNKAPGKQFMRIYDFNEDAMCIYSSFLQAYGIDLTDIDFLHWWKFCALLENLPAHTPMAQRMAYRAMDLSLIKDKAQRDYYEKIKREFEIKKPRDNNFGRAGNKACGATAQEIANYNIARVKHRFELAKSIVSTGEKL